MSVRKMSQSEELPASNATTVIPRARKKPRAPRVRLTHLEIRRGDALRLRMSIADEAIAEAGDELGALIKKISPSARTSVVAEPTPPDFVSPPPAEHDASYHASFRDHLTEVFGSLCDTSLADVLEIAREERARRAEGGN